MSDQQKPLKDQTSRRQFIKTSAVATATATGAAIASRAYAAGDDKIKIGLIGCGGRGSGAAGNALDADSGTVLVAMADAFPDPLERSHKAIKAQYKDRVQVDDDHKLVGFDAYKGVIEASDVVLLGTTPHFRPIHLEAAVAAGKHVFAEKPVATDGPMLRRCWEASREAERKNLSLVSGLVYRYQTPKQELIEQIHNGAIGDVKVIEVKYNTGGLWHRGGDNPATMEYQMRNWYYFNWLSGDHITEQHVHSLDKMLWIMKDELPEYVVASGGRIVRNAPMWGNIFDHFNCTFHWKNGVKGFASCRQWSNTFGDVSDFAYGTKGTAAIQDHRLTNGDGNWKAPSGMGLGEAYTEEHRHLFRSIRQGKPINNGDYMCKSTLLALMGRMSAYTGQKVTAEQALNSTESLSPKSYEWGPLDVRPVAQPGKTKLV